VDLYADASISKKHTSSILRAEFHKMLLHRKKVHIFTVVETSNIIYGKPVWTADVPAKIQAEYLRNTSYRGYDIG
jgi:hypothetical protein